VAGAPSFAPAGFFALRTPLLPFEVLEAWGGELEAAQAAPGSLEQALGRDRQRLRERLRQWVKDPVIHEALFVASPVLEESLPTWYSEPESERGQKVERTLVRYFVRMAGRATPFGLFAGMSMGQLAERTRLHLAERSELSRHTRLDMDYVCALVDKVRHQPEVRRALRYVPNSSLYRAAGRLRYLEVRYRERARSYHLVAVEPSPYLEATLERARGGATVDTLAESLAAADPDISVEEARDFVEELIEAQLLVSTWNTPLTGPEPVPYLLEQARDIAPLALVRERLGAVQQALAGIDARRSGVAPEAYRQVAGLLKELPVPAELPRLFQVDMFRPAPEASLSRRVADELLRGALALQQLTPRTSADTDPLARFRDRFLERYEGRSVPLTEALDEESGIGFERSNLPGAGTGPLLQGFHFPVEAAEERFRNAANWRHLLRRLQEAWHTGSQELVLTDEDLRAMKAREPVSFPDSVGVAGTVVAPSAEAVDQGQFRVLVENVHASGAVYLGRFCHGDARLEAAVRDYLRAEEALRPDAVFAEIVHLPQGRHGNVICRPALRQHDLVFLGQSGVPEAERIEIADLWVSVEQGRVMLRSKRLGKEVIPRLTNAYNTLHGLGIYRFLAAMQHQGRFGVGFRWGPFAGADHLPRVVYGRSVLSLAYWNVHASRLEEWGAAEGAARFEAVQRFRRQANLPRWVCLKDGDNLLPIDLDNVLCIETLVQLTRNRASIVLEEIYPGLDGLCVEGRDGRYVHEVVVPFLRQAPAAKAAAEPAPRPAAPPPGFRRTFPPGSEWLYLKLYAGEAHVDRLLRGTLAEQLGAIRASGVVDRWFFIRYGDPGWHLRLRLRGEPSRLFSEVWPALAAACGKALEEGEGWKLQLDTYEREVERYGGPVGIELAEELFHADSEAVLDLLQAYPGEEYADLRWRLALRGMDALLEDLGLTLEEKSGLLQRLRAGFGKEFRATKPFEEQLGLRYRRESKTLDALLSLGSQASEPWQEGIRALERRSARLRPVAERLQKAEREGQLTLPRVALAESFLHMHANRLLVSDHRAQEFILYDFLERLYRSRLARQRKAGS
jgi:thiopeptide-type bacteriocin biosynthesis protein